MKKISVLNLGSNVLVGLILSLGVSLAHADSLSKTVYDFDDTLVSTNMTNAIFRVGVDAAQASPSDVQEITTADWAEVRQLLGKEGPYKDWIIVPSLSFRAATGAPGVNRFREQLQETLASRTTEQWQAPKWSEFVMKMATPESSKDIYILTARSTTAQNIKEGFEFLQSQALIKNTMPVENIYAVSDPSLTLKSDPSHFLAKEKTEIAKSLVMQDMLDALEKDAASQDLIGEWSFYDDDFGNFSKANESLAPLAATRWPHVLITIGYVGSRHANTNPYSVVIQPVALPMKKAASF